MRLLPVLASLGVSLVLAQEQPVSTPGTVLPERQKALENAFRTLFSRRDAKPVLANPAETRCGYIRIVPADPAIDPRMIVPDSGSRTQEASRSRMPVRPGLPPCDSNLPPRP